MGIVEKNVFLQTKDENNNVILYCPYTKIENVEGAIKTINGVKPDDSGNVEIPMPAITVSNGVMRIE